MSSPPGKCKHRSGKNDYSDKQTIGVCRALANLIPCFRRRLSPTSSKCSSKTSRNNYFLENHFIVKCPKHSVPKEKLKRERSTHAAVACREKANSSERTETTFNQLLPNVGKKIKLPQKEIRYITAKKKSDDNKKYINILGMEPCAYLDQFSSVFVKNLKDPVPKDPLALPRKYNVYIPPRKKYCQDKQPYCSGKHTQLLPAIEEKSSTSVSKKSFQFIIKEKYKNLKKNLKLKKNTDSYGLKKGKQSPISEEDIACSKEESSYVALAPPPQKIKSSLKSPNAAVQQAIAKESNFKDDNFKCTKRHRVEVTEHQKCRPCDPSHSQKGRHKLVNVNINNKHYQSKHQKDEDDDEDESVIEDRHHHLRRCREEFRDREKPKLKSPKLIRPKEPMHKKTHRMGEFNVMRCELKNDNVFDRSHQEVGDPPFPNKLLVWKVVIKDEKNISPL